MRGVIDWHDARLRAMRDLGPDLRLFEIEPDPGGFEPPTPGSHIEVAVHIGRRPDRRSYSLVGPYTGPIYRIAVKRLAASRGGSATMWRLAPGDALQVSRPANDFALRPGQAGYILVAGGIGITARREIERLAPQAEAYVCGPLSMLEAVGVAMISDCRRGECSLGALDILSVEGVVDHRDIFFSDDEKAGGRKLCTCVSRVAGRSITLDTPDRPA